MYDSLLGQRISHEKIRKHLAVGGDKSPACQKSLKFSH